MYNTKLNVSKGQQIVREHSTRYGREKVRDVVEVTSVWKDGTIQVSGQGQLQWNAFGYPKGKARGTLRHFDEGETPETIARDKAKKLESRREDREQKKQEYARRKAQAIAPYRAELADPKIAWALPETTYTMLVKVPSSSPDRPDRPDRLIRLLWTVEEKELYDWEAGESYTGVEIQLDEQYLDEHNGSVRFHSRSYEGKDVADAIANYLV